MEFLWVKGKWDLKTFPGQYVLPQVFWKPWAPEASFKMKKIMLGGMSFTSGIILTHCSQVTCVISLLCFFK